MDDKLSLDAVFARYELEPTLIDIYVEGESDKIMIDWFLSRQPESSATVYPIELIDIPETLVEKHGLSVGSNRSKVAALSAELYSRFQDRIRVICVVDRDFEDYLPTLPDPSLLALTDGNSLETYVLSENSLHKFTSIILGGFVLSPAQLLEGLTASLREIYALRLANEKLGWGMKFLPLKSYVSIVGSAFEFRKEAFINAYLLKNGKTRHKEMFLQTLESCAALLPGDSAKTTRGHDIAELLLYLVRKYKPERKFGNWETLEGVLLGTLEIQSLETYPLFKRMSDLARLA